MDDYLMEQLATDGMIETNDGITEEEADALLGKLVATTTLEDLANVDIVFEAMVENMELKKDAFAKLAPVIKPEAIFVSNTSSLSITEMGLGLKHPVIGMHFFNPVPAMKLVEVIAGGNTPAEPKDEGNGEFKWNGQKEVWSILPTTAAGSSGQPMAVAYSAMNQSRSPSSFLRWALSMLWPW